FMQAGFAFLEAGLTRMKNAAHIAGKNVLIFAVCSIVYWAVGFGIAFGDGNSFVGTSGFFPSSNELLAIGQAPYSFFTGIPAASGYLFEVVFAGVSLAIVWGAMAERAKLWVYPAFGVVFTGDRIGYFGYVALTTNIAAAAGAIGGIASAWLILRKPDVSMMLNGVLAALVAITAASGFVAPWAAIVIGGVSGWIAVAGVLFVERLGIDDPIGAVAVHGMSGVWGTLATGLVAVPALASNLATGKG